MAKSKDDGVWQCELPPVTVRLFVRGGRVVFVETEAEGVNLRGWPWAWMATEQRSFRWCRAAVSIGLRGKRPAGLFAMRRLDPPPKPRNAVSGRTTCLPRVSGVKRPKKKRRLTLPSFGGPAKPPPLGADTDVVGGPPPTQPPEPQDP